MMSTDFKSRLNQLWDSLFTEGISSPVAAIDQLSYLFFIKWLEVTDDPKNSIFEGKFFYEKSVGSHDMFKWKMKWSNLRKMPESSRVEFLATAVFTWLKDAKATRQKFSNHLQNCVFLISKPSLLAEAMEAVESAFPFGENANPDDENFWEEPAEAYEFLLEKMIYQRSNLVRTPPELADMLCSLAAPNATDTVCDPACGTGDLLIATKRYLQRNTAGSRTSIISKSKLNESLTGYEADTVITRLAMMNLMLHGIGNPKISQKSLLVTSTTNEKFSLIISSPPAASISTKDMMEPGSSETVTTELRFLEELVKLMNIEGRAILLIPENILTDMDTGAIQLRKRLMETCIVDAVLVLLAGNVTQYSVNMAILCFTKREPEDIKKNTSQIVWFYETVYQDYSSAVLAYEKRKVNIPANRQGQQFYVPLYEIQDNDFSLSISLYRKLEQKPVEKKDIEEEEEDDEEATALGISSKTLKSIFSTQNVPDKKFSLPGTMVNSLASILPHDHKELIAYLPQLTLDELLSVSTAGKDKKESVTDKLVKLLQEKKATIMAEAEKLGQQHPYQLWLHQACEIKYGPNDQTINLLTIARENGLKDFTIPQLLDVLMASGKEELLDGDERRASEKQLELSLQTALIIFVAKTEKAFTFPTLQKVLAQLQFLPHFTVLRNFIWRHLGRDGFLRQLYIGKEHTAQPATGSNGFELFETIPGHLHLIHADEFPKLQTQL